jgi:hypothetical protein
MRNIGLSFKCDPEDDYFATEILSSDHLKFLKKLNICCKMFLTKALYDDFAAQALKILLF